MFRSFARSLLRLAAPSMRPAVLALVALVSGAAGGVLSSRALREARADAGGEIVVPVPSQGVVFRGSGGKALARVAASPAGGVVEVLDAREQVAVRLRATSAGGVIEVGAPRMATPSLPLVRSPDDPGY